MPSIRHSLAWAFSTKYSLLIIHFISTVIIARLVTPEDIGIYTIASVFIGLGHLVREFGVSRYIIQEPDLTPERIRAASSLNIAFGWSIGGIIFLSSGILGEFYEKQEIREALLLLTVNFIFVPFGAITFAYLRRQMRFRETMIVQVWAALIGTCIGIIAAYEGEGYRALVWSAISGTISTVILAQFYRPNEVSLLPGLAEIPHVFRFCKYAGTSSVINELNNSAAPLILGRTLGIEPVGFLSRASGTMNMFNAVIMDSLIAVLLPYFSNSNRSGQDTNTAYGHLVSCITALAWPFFLSLALLASPIIYFLYGDQWLPAVEIIQLMCIGAIISALFSSAADLLTAHGHIKSLFHISLLLTALRIGIILATTRYGLLIVIAALQIAPFIRFILVHRLLYRTTKFRLGEISAHLYKNVGVTMATTTPMAIMVYFFGPDLEFSIIYFLISCGLGGVSWLIAVYLMKPAIYLEINPLVIQLLSHLRPATEK